MRKLFDRLYIFPFQFSFFNVFLIEINDGYLLIDTGTSPEAMQKAFEEMTKNNMNPADIRHVFITHAHYDHIGGLAFVQQQNNARTFAHQRETAIIRGEKQAIFASDKDLGILGRFVKNTISSRTHSLPARVDAEVKDGDTILDEFTVIELPGHAYGHIGLWWEDKRTLFGGDVVIRYPWGIRPPFIYATPDMPEAKRSIKKIATLNPETLCICHGRPIINNAGQALKQLTDSLS